MYPSSIVLGLQSIDKQYGEPLQRSWLYILVLTSKLDEPEMCAYRISRMRCSYHARQKCQRNHGYCSR